MGKKVKAPAIEHPELLLRMRKDAMIRRIAQETGLRQIDVAAAFNSYAGIIDEQRANPDLAMVIPLPSIGSFHLHKVKPRKFYNFSAREVQYTQGGHKLTFKTSRDKGQSK